MTKFFLKNSHCDLDLNPITLKRELVRGIVIFNICVKLYRNWIINAVARAMPKGEHTNERTYLRTYVLTYILTGQTLYPLHKFVARGDNKVSGSQSEIESDISDLSLSESMETATTVTTTDEPGPEVENVSTYVTLSDTHWQKISDLMQASFQPQMVQIIQESFKSQVSDLVSSFVQGVLQGLQTKVATFENENADLKNRVTSLETALDNAEQYSRRNCFKISGVPDTTELSTDDYVCNLARAIDVDLTIDDIDRSHRLSKPHTGADQRAKPRDIIVKFISYRKRASFYKACILTKSRGFQCVFVNERLTRDVPFIPYLYLTDGNQTKNTYNVLRRLQNDIN